MSDALVTVGIQSSGGSGVITVIDSGSGSANVTRSFSVNAIFAILIPTGGYGDGVSSNVIGNSVLLFPTGNLVMLAGYCSYNGGWYQFNAGTAKLSISQLVVTFNNSNNYFKFNYVVLG